MPKNKDHNIQKIFFISMILYAITLHHVLPAGMPVTSGDASIYIKAINNGALELNHFGYLLIGRKIIEIMPSIPAITIIGLISALSASLSLVFSYLIARKILKKNDNALIATFITAVSGTFWLYSTVIEIYTFQLVFLWGSFYFLLEKRSNIASLFFLTGLFVSLTTIFFLPALFFIAYRNKQIKKFLINQTLVALTYALLSFDELYYVLHGAKTGMHLIEAPLANLYYTTQSFLFFLPLAILGIYTLYRHEKKTLALIATAVLPYAYFLFFNWDHGVFILPTYVFISMLAVYALDRYNILNKKRLMLGMLSIFFIFELLLVVDPVINDSNRFDTFTKRMIPDIEGSQIYSRYDYGEILTVTLNQPYTSYQKPYTELKKELDTEIGNGQVFILDIEKSRIDSRNIFDYHPTIRQDYTFKEESCSDEFYIYTIFMTLEKNRYCIYTIEKNQP